MLGKFERASDFVSLSEMQRALIDTYKYTFELKFSRIRYKYTFELKFSRIR